MRKHVWHHGFTPSRIGKLYICASRMVFVSSLFKKHCAFSYNRMRLERMATGLFVYEINDQGLEVNRVQLDVGGGFIKSHEVSERERSHTFHMIQQLVVAANMVTSKENITVHKAGATPARRKPPVDPFASLTRRLAQSSGSNHLDDSPVEKESSLGQALIFEAGRAVLCMR